MILSQIVNSQFGRLGVVKNYVRRSTMAGDRLGIAKIHLGIAKISFLRTKVKKMIWSQNFDSTRASPPGGWGAEGDGNPFGL